ncbi:sensor histidine kinase [Clostridium oryzae]|uniref:histidine kinase n=1 Tax=Clostridium oryzae TaxID=1450648 RepID=A0A1V4INS3_9CLOT|nr:HAMP domain-containing sensor histidine kinase [Clostridium oryzae]OPJ61435.1 heme sensor protein HssS [Clostridium oryzae]
MMRWNSIRTKFIVIESVFFIAVVGGAALLFILFGKDYYINCDRRKMNKAFSELYKINLKKLEKNNTRMISKYEDDGFRFVVATNDYYGVIDVIYSTIQGHSNEKIRNGNYRVMEHNLHMGKFSREPEANYNNNHNIDLYGIIKQGGRDYYIYIYEYTSQLKNELEYSEKFLILILIVLILVGGVLIFFLTDKITKPIKKIDIVANKISQMDFSEQIQEDKYFGEIGSLSKSINRMSEQMQRYINDLENYNYILLEENCNMTEMTEMRRNFVSNMSHELKTPLAIISSQVEIIMEMDDKVDKEYYFNSILEETDKMSRMVSEMLEVSFVENSLNHMEMEEINITEITKKLLLKYEAVFLQKQIHCGTDIEKDCFVMGNGRYLEKAINNYLLNAYEHTKNGSEIKVKLYTKDSEIILSVYNEGSKIEDKDMDKIWLNYYQQSKCKKFNANQKNVGLGLYIVKSIIDQHHGICNVENKEKGVEFNIRLKKLNL